MKQFLWFINDNDPSIKYRLRYNHLEEQIPNFAGFRKINSRFYRFWEKITIKKSLKNFLQEKISLQEITTSENNPVGSFGYKNRILIQLRWSIVPDLKMKLEKILQRKRHLWCIRSKPEICCYLLLQFSFLVFCYCRFLMKSPKLVFLLQTTL